MSPIRKFAYWLLVIGVVLFVISNLVACAPDLTDQQREVLRRAEAPSRIATFTYVKDIRTDLCFAMSPGTGPNSATYSATNVPCTEQVLKQIQQ